MIVVSMGAVARAQADELTPKYTLKLIYNYESNDFTFAIGDSRFATVSSLKRFIAGLPAGSILEWGLVAYALEMSPYSRLKSR